MSQTEALNVGAGETVVRTTNGPLLFATAHTLDINGNGGNHRTAQIAELLGKADVQYCGIPEAEIPRLSWLSSSLRYCTENFGNLKLSYHVVKNSGILYKKYRQAFARHTGARVLLWEATGGFNRVAVQAAREANYPIVAIPQNLESLVSSELDSFTGRGLPESLKSEISHLAQAAAVFCISREEQWLLNLHGVTADFLPYYPSVTILESLLKIRALRARATKPSRILILGTVLNIPTRIGTIELLKWLKQIDPHRTLEVDIAGYGTEHLGEFCDSPNYTLHGSVSPEKLQQLLVEARLMLVHQVAGAGALTRIPEMLIAGLPVVASSNAARSAYHHEGVYCYENQQELAERLNSTLVLPGPLLPPTEAQQRFQSKVKMLCRQQEEIAC